MPAPIVVTAAKVAVTNPKVRRGLMWAAGLTILTPIIVLTMAIAFFAQADCSAMAGSDDFAGQFDGPGALGGVMGTGVTRSELRTARNHPYGGTTAVPHDYTSTAYAPAAGGINCDVGNKCGSTASGIRVNAGKRKAYLIASNPRQNKYGALVYAWPNPYGWKGPFVVADTGGNFDGSDGAYRVDFYIWGDASEKRSNSWGRRATRISTKPIVSGGPTTDVDTTIDQLTGGEDEVASGEQCAGGGETPPDGTKGYEGVVQWADWLDKQQYPYCYGGGHVTPAVPTHGQYCWNRAGTAKISTGKGYDCSSSTSFILQHAGYKLQTMATPGFVSWGKRGPGQKVTIYNKPYGADAHVFLKIGNRFFSTSVSNPAHGPGWVPASIRSTAGFTMSHPEGL